LVSLPVTLIHEETLIVGITRNLSLGGAFVEIAERLAFGSLEPLVEQTLTLSLELPNSLDDLYCEANVRWVSDTGLGLCFLGLGARQRESLGSLLSRLEPQREALRPPSPAQL
jgi:hypothetical protein